MTGVIQITQEALDPAELRWPSRLPWMRGRCTTATSMSWNPIRTPERIQEHFLGLPLVPPGLDFLARWFPKSLSARSSILRSCSRTSGFSWRASGANHNRRGKIREVVGSR